MATANSQHVIKLSLATTIDFWVPAASQDYPRGTGQQEKPNGE